MTDEEIKSQIQKKLFVSRVLSIWPLLVWVGVIVIAIWGHHNSQKKHSFIGRVVQDTLIISAVEDAIITSINVRPGQSVINGSLLGKLDTTNIDLLIEELTIEILQDHRERERRYIEARHRLIEQQQNLLLRQTEDQALLRVLEEEDILLSDLHSKHLIERKLYVNNLASVETLRSSIEKYPILITEISEEMYLLEQTKSIWNIDDLDQLIESDERLKLLNRQKEAMILTAKDKGTISQVFAHQGETVLAGKPIISLVLSTEPRITAFIPEATLELPMNGDTLYVTTMTQKGNWLPSRVTQLAPDVVMVPDQASPLPGKMITGRYCYLELIQTAALVNGESVLVTRKKPGILNFLNTWKDEDSVAMSQSTTDLLSEN